MQEEKKSFTTEEVQDDKYIPEEGFSKQNLLLARLYDICVELGKIVEITGVETEDGQKIIAILLKDVVYSKENGFEKS